MLKTRSKLKVVFLHMVNSGLDDLFYFHVYISMTQKFPDIPRLEIKLACQGHICTLVVIAELFTRAKNMETTEV
jgi:hypothetical protein